MYARESQQNGIEWVGRQLEMGMDAGELAAHIAQKLAEGLGSFSEQFYLGAQGELAILKSLEDYGHVLATLHG